MTSTDLVRVLERIGFEASQRTAVFVILEGRGRTVLVPSGPIEPSVLEVLLRAAGVSHEQFLALLAEEPRS